MARQYPRFLYSNPTNTKSKGPFVVHLLFPRFICRVVDDVEELRGKEVYYIHHGGWILELLEVLEHSVDDAIKRKVSDTMHDMLTWLPKQQQEIEVLYDRALDSSAAELVRIKKQRNKLKDILSKINAMTDPEKIGENPDLGKMKKEVNE